MERRKIAASFQDIHRSIEDAGSEIDGSLSTRKNISFVCHMFDHQCRPQLFLKVVIDRDSYPYEDKGKNTSPLDATAGSLQVVARRISAKSDCE